MTVHTGETFHGGALLTVFLGGHVLMDLFVLVARYAVPFLEAEFMGLVSMAFRTLDLLIEYMFRMISRTAYIRGIGVFGVFVPVTGKTEFPGHDNLTMTRIDGFLAQENKLVHLYHLLLLCRMMTLMTVNAPVHAYGPSLVGIGMNMACRAGIGVVLKIIVDFVGGKEHPYTKQQDKNRDHYPGFPGNFFGVPRNQLVKQL
jgi:hypothetical protein